MLSDDGDVIRGLGFVTLYSAYAEEQVDLVLNELNSIEAFGEKKRRQPISVKLARAESLIKKLGSTDLQDLEAALAAGPELFECRNLLIHGRIYGNFGSCYTLRSARLGVPDREVTSSELYLLANDMDEYVGALLGDRVFGRLQRAVADYRSRSSR